MRLSRRGSVTEEKSLNAEEGLDLAIVMRLFWIGKWRILASVVLCTAVFVIFALISTPIYRASVVMVPASSNSAGLGGLSSALGQLGGLASLAGINLQSQEPATEEALAVLRSREFTERFIQSQKLMPVLFEDKWDSAKGDWNVSREKQPTFAAAYKKFDKRIRHINNDKKTGLVTLDIDWKDPKQAAAWANMLIDQLNSEMRKRAMEDSDASVGYLQKELAATALVDIRTAIARLLEARINQRMLASVSKEYAFKVIDRALPPDPKDQIKPQRVLLTVLGCLLGLFLGGVVVLMPAVRRTSSE
jgi:uncharacterized protein involved in exopolysaccharide biosynthesis